MTNLIFDLDGTLIDSASDVKRILTEAALQCGFTVSADVIRVGPQLPQIVEKALPNASQEARTHICKRFRTLYQADALAATVPFPRIVETLKSLNAQSKRVFVATFKVLSSAGPIMERHFKGLYVDIATPEEHGGEKGQSKAVLIRHLMNKWGLLPTDTLMIGDTKGDLDGAREAGIPFAACLYGYGGGMETADFKARTVEELVALLCLEGGQAPLC